MRKAVLIAAIAAIVALPVSAVALVYALRPPAQVTATGPPPSPYRGSQPPARLFAPRFALRSYRGPFVRMDDLRGKVVLVTFLDTKCRTKCPVIAADVGEAMRLLSQSERRDVVALAISVEPKTDTPQSVHRFLRRRHALGVLDFLIGSERRLEPIWNAFHIVAAAQTGNADVHSADVRVFDRRGLWVSTLHVPVDLTPANLAHDVRLALRSRDGVALTTDALRNRFAVLSARHSNRCGLRPESLDSIATHGRLQGSCCSAMKFAHYVKQVRSLAAYPDVPEVPSDPYDVSVELAKRLTSYASIELTRQQRAIYSQAMKLSNEHGPCCCHCWRWTAFEGQAKYLIVRRGYGASRIAEVWNLEDGCGG